MDAKNLNSYIITGGNIIHHSNDYIIELPETPGVSRSEVVSMALEVTVVVVASPVVPALVSVLC